MLALATIDHDNRFDQELSPPCYYRFDTKTDSSIYAHFLEMVVDELKTACDVVYMEAIILDFCEGWNDYKRYRKGEYSEQQIIKYHTNRTPRSKRYTKVDAYAAGVNTAARYGKKVFFWTNPRFYKQVGGLATIPEEVE